MTTQTLIFFRLVQALILVLVDLAHEC